MGLWYGLKGQGQGSNKQTETHTGEPKSGPHRKASHSGSPIPLPRGYVGHTGYPNVPGAQEMISFTTIIQITVGETEAQRVTMTDQGHMAISGGAENQSLGVPDPKVSGLSATLIKGQDWPSYN